MEEKDRMCGMSLFRSIFMTFTRSWTIPKTF